MKEQTMETKHPVTARPQDFKFLIKELSAQNAVQALMEITERLHSGSVETKDLVAIAQLAQLAQPQHANGAVDDAFDSLSVNELRELIAGLNALTASRAGENSIRAGAEITGIVDTPESSR